MTIAFVLIPKASVPAGCCFVDLQIRKLNLELGISMLRKLLLRFVILVAVFNQLSSLPKTYAQGRAVAEVINEVRQAAGFFLRGPAPKLLSEAQASRLRLLPPTSQRAIVEPGIIEPAVEGGTYTADSTFDVSDRLRRMIDLNPDRLTTIAREDLDRLHADVRRGPYAPEPRTPRRGLAPRVDESIDRAAQFLSDVGYAETIPLTPSTPEVVARSWEAAVPFLAADYPVNLLVEDVQWVEPMRRLVKSNYPSSTQTLVLYQRNAILEQALKDLDGRPSRITIYEDVPSTDGQFENIYGFRDPLLLESVQRGKSRLHYSVGIRFVDLTTVQGMSVAEQLRRDVARQIEGELTIAVGHVTAGALKFHDGSSLRLADIQGNGKTIVVGCDTLRYSTPENGLAIKTSRSLTSNEAISLGIWISRSLSKMDGSYRKSLLQLQNAGHENTTEISQEIDAAAGDALPVGPVPVVPVLGVVTTVIFVGSASDLA